MLLTLELHFQIASHKWYKFCQKCISWHHSSELGDLPGHLSWSFHGNDDKFSHISFYAWIVQNHIQKFCCKLDKQIHSRVVHQRHLHQYLILFVKHFLLNHWIHLDHCDIILSTSIVFGLVIFFKLRSLILLICFVNELVIFDFMRWFYMH